MDRVVRSAIDIPCSIGIDSFADDDVVIAALDDLRHLELDTGRSAFKYRRTGRAVTIGFATDLAVFNGRRFEKRVGGALLTLA